MTFTVVMPHQGTSVEQCVIYRWRKNIGDLVTKGETLFEIETDKAVVEIESGESGILLEIFYKAGDEVAVKTPIAIIGYTGETVTCPPQAEQLLVSPLAYKRANEQGFDLDRRQAVGANGRMQGDTIGSATPRLTRAAQVLAESGIPIPPNGTGVGGRITIEDMLAAAVTQTPSTTELDTTARDL